MITTKPIQENAHFPIRNNLDSDSNSDWDSDWDMTQENELHWEKQDPFKTWGDGGMTIWTKQVSKNAHFAIRDSLDSDSNITDEGHNLKIKITVVFHIAFFENSRIWEWWIRLMKEFRVLY
jgi:hypothetical protein